MPVLLLRLLDRACTQCGSIQEVDRLPAVPRPVQLRNFAVPASLAGVSLGTVLLATCGNSLMVPRALFTDDAVWFAGGIHACFGRCSDSRKAACCL